MCIRGERARRLCTGPRVHQQFRARESPDRAFQTGTGASDGAWLGADLPREVLEPRRAASQLELGELCEPGAWAGANEFAAAKHVQIAALQAAIPLRMLH